MANCNIIVGTALLFAGRYAEWLFVAAVGFIAGGKLAADGLLNGREDWMIAVFAAGFGVTGALLCGFLQPSITGITGFLAGGYILHQAASSLNLESLAWFAFIIGGVIGALLLTACRNRALILLSSLTGATAITQNVSLPPPAAVLLFALLLSAGVTVQTRRFTGDILPRREVSPDEGIES